MWPLESKFTFTGLVYAFRYFLISFILGISLGSLLSFKIGFLFLLILIGGFLFWRGFKLSHYRHWLWGICFIGLALGELFGNKAFLDFRSQQELIKTLDGKTIIFSGKVTQVEETRTGLYLIVRAEEIDGQKISSLKPKICFYLNQTKKVTLNSLLELKGYVFTGSKPNLNCAAYLKSSEILQETISSKQSFNVILLNVKDKIHSLLGRNIREPFLGLAQGYILGDDRTTNSEVIDILEKSSMTHIVAVSGFNIAIVFLMTNRLLSFFHLSPHKTYHLVVGIGLIFILLSGHPASALRAGLMLSLALGAERLQRMGNSINILLLAATIMLIFNPLILIYDLGFQLSFLASLGLIFRQFLSPKDNRLSLGLSKLKGIFQDIFKDTFYVLLFVSPLLAYYQGIISLKPILANLPILPLMPGVTLLIILIVFCSWGLPSLALILGFLAERIIAAQLFILKIISQLNFLNLNTGYFSFYWIIFYYICLAQTIRVKIKQMRIII